MSQFAWTADASGQRTWFNKRWYDYTGTTLEEVEGTKWQKLVHPDHIERVNTRIRESHESGKPWEETYPLRSRDGNFRWFLTRAVAIRNANGDVVRWFGTNTDVTRQVEAEKALRLLNESLEHRVGEQAKERDRIWSVSPDLLVVADTNGTLLSVNPPWTATLGWSETDLIGKTADWLRHPDDTARTHLELARLLGGRKTLLFENRLRHRDGSYRWLSWTAVVDEGSVYAVARDVTDLKNAEEQLRVSRHELTQISRQTTMGAMTASIAHEVNQPLAAIVANANAALRWLARGEPDLTEVRVILKRIVGDGHRASRVVTSIRSMFAKDRGETSLLTINELIEEVLNLVNGELASHRISMRKELHDKLPSVMADRVQIQQVLVNLIMNALEAMSTVADRERVLIVKSEDVQSDHVLIPLQDSGTGIDPAHVDRIFDAFFTTKDRGMGMGLSICRSIVESHGGQLWASPNKPHGTSFYLKLPTATPSKTLEG
jgi:PAS domain S-box-containing protein